jgi:hypothetical protein
MYPEETRVTEAEWLAATDPKPMLASLRGRIRERKLRLFASACVRHVWLLLDDSGSRNAVEVLERYCDGETTFPELDAAGATAYDAVRCEQDGNPRDGARTAASLWARRAAYYATGVAWIARDATWFAAKNAAEQAAGAATAKGGAAEGVAARRRQALALACVVGPRLSVQSPARLAVQGIKVVQLARAAYENRRLPEGDLDPSHLALLADALEDAGCTDADLLGHLRGPGPHVRGCWAVDLVLGKE